MNEVDKVLGVDGSRVGSFDWAMGSAEFDLAALKCDDDSGTTICLGQLDHALLPMCVTCPGPMLRQGSRRIATWSECHERCGRLQLLSLDSGVS